MHVGWHEGDGQGMQVRRCVTGKGDGGARARARVRVRVRVRVRAGSTAWARQCRVGKG